MPFQNTWDGITCYLPLLKVSVGTKVDIAAIIIIHRRHRRRHCCRRHRLTEDISSTMLRFPSRARSRIAR
eukprot:1172641-Rhodomonas_salina.1